MLEEQDDLNNRTEEFKKSYGKITGTVYPGTTIKVYDKVLKIQDPKTDLFISGEEEEDESPEPQN